MRHLSFFLLLVTMFASGCKLSFSNGGRQESPASSADYENTRLNANTEVADPNSGIGRATPDKSAATVDCQTVKPGDYVVIKEQTFAIDFEPFRGSCFVTSRNPEYKGTPVESEFAIYKNGQKVFDFPEQFNGTAFGCRVEAVSFQDLNGDDLTDIIIVAKCSGKDATYNESSVYVNTGKAFTTDLDANYKLQEFSRVRDVAAYVKSHKELFFKR